jgi:hypothetical protein
MNEVGRIFLSWRKSVGSSRHIIGVIKKAAAGRVTFEYLQNRLEPAYKDGFVPYTDFPEITNTYVDNVLEIFGQRLTNMDRSDISHYANFWGLDPKFQHDKYYLLAHTQGWLATDNFEFLAEFLPVRNLRFVTDLAGLSKNAEALKILNVGDRLTFKKEPENLFDAKAILIMKDNTKVAYIKRIHNLVFHHPRSSSLKVGVKAIEDGVQVRKVFVEVSI